MLTVSVRTLSTCVETVSVRTLSAYTLTVSVRTLSACVDCFSEDLECMC